MKCLEMARLVGNHNRLDELLNDNISLAVITPMFNDDVFKEEPATQEEMATLIKFSKPLRNRSLSKRKTATVIRVTKEMRADPINQ